MWVTIIIPSIPPLWPFFRQTWQATTDRLLGSMSQTGARPLQLKEVGRGHGYGAAHRAHAGGSAQADLEMLGSRTDSSEGILPPDGILMTKDVSVSPAGRESVLPKAARLGTPVGAPGV